MSSRSAFAVAPAIVAALALSGCMGTTAPIGVGGEVLDPSARAWTLNGNLPDPAINTAYQVDASNDASFATAISSVRLSNGGTTGLSYDPRLDQAAQSYAGYLHATNQFSHDAGGSTIGSRVAATGYPYRKVGENLAKGYTSEGAVIAAWENSPGHKANQNDPDFEDFALGVSGTGQDTIWVLVLGDPL